MLQEIPGNHKRDDLKPILIHPVYFGNIAHYVAMATAETITFEIHDNYQKQTFRNRTYIANPEGRLLLNIPIKHTSRGERGTRKKVHQKYKDVRIENDFPWQKEHWRSIQIAYRTSPFFEYYEDEIAPLYEKKAEFLMDFNLRSFELICELTGLDKPVSHSSEYAIETQAHQDMRFLANSKEEGKYNFDPYTQVLQKHHGYLPNLSILDLLFNEGTNALTYLEKQSL